MFTARYELIPYVKQITFRLQKVKINYFDADPYSETNPTTISYIHGIHMASKQPLCFEILD